MTVGAQILIEGSPLVTDPADPNAVAPTPTRLMTVPVDTRGSGPRAILYYLLDGTSASVTTWFLDPTLAKWITIQAGLAIAAPLVVVASSRVIPVGVPYYTQITAVAGAPTKLLGLFI